MADCNDITAIKRLDKSDMYSKLTGFPNQVRDAYNNLSDIRLPSLKNDKYGSIVIAGMGGSAIGGDFVRALLLDESTIPLLVVRNYSLPRFVGKNSLVIAVSYSGNTEEVIAVYQEARRRGSTCVVVSSGGKLSSAARNDKVPLITVKEGYHPREAVGYLLLSIYHILGETRLFSIRLEDIEMLSSFLEQSGSKLVSEVSESENSAKFMAGRCFGKLPIIFCDGGVYEVAAKRLKNQLAENSKVLSFVSVLPESNHNEIVGFEKLTIPGEKLIAIMIYDELSHPRIKAGMKAVSRILGDRGIEIMEIKPAGTSCLERIFSLIQRADFSSFYLAILNDQDPSPIKSIDDLKRELAGQ